MTLSATVGTNVVSMAIQSLRAALALSIGLTWPRHAFPPVGDDAPYCLLLPEEIRALGFPETINASALSKKLPTQVAALLKGPVAGQTGFGS
jgi:hypothetical protein